MHIILERHVRSIICFFKVSVTYVELYFSIEKMQHGEVLLVIFPSMHYIFISVLHSDCLSPIKDYTTLMCFLT